MATIGVTLSKDLDKLFKKKFKLKLEEMVDQIKEVIVDTYDAELVDVVTDRNSRTNPNLYRDDFINRLNEFNYVENLNGSVSLIVPDMENFDFSGRMRVIETIMRGVVGTYVEVDEEEYTKIFSKKPINESPLDEYIPPKERIYLIKYTGKIQRAERDLSKKLVRYPFSNRPPIDILSAADKFVNDNMDRWIEETIEEAQKEFVITHKGVTL